MRYCARAYSQGPHNLLVRIPECVQVFRFADIKAAGLPNINRNPSEARDASIARRLLQHDATLLSTLRSDALYGRDVALWAAVGQQAPPIRRQPIPFASLHYRRSPALHLSAHLPYASLAITHRYDSMSHRRLHILASASKLRI